MVGVVSSTLSFQKNWDNLLKAKFFFGKIVKLELIIVSSVGAGVY